MKNVNRALVVAEQVWNKQTRTFDLKFAARRTQTIEVGNAGCSVLVRDPLHGEYAMYDNEVIFDTFAEANRVVVDYNLLLDDDTVIKGKWDAVKRAWVGVEHREETGSTNDREYYVE